MSEMEARSDDDWNEQGPDILRPYASNFLYNAAGAVTAMRLGNGRWENTEFNSRLQPTKIGLGSGVASQSLLKLEYSYGTTANNGNVVEQKITVPGVAHPYIQAYTYDELNRLAAAEETKNSSQEWKQTFVYDRYGNRNFATTSGATTTLPSGFDPDIYNPTINTTNNRFSSGQGYSYDTSGNTTLDAENRKFSYDAENKQVKVETVDGSGNPTATIGEYFYDGDGKRTKKFVPGTGETTIFVYDAGGKLIGEYSSIVQTGSNAKTVYTTNDHLGSPRINTDVTGQVISRHDYHPFGEEIARTGYGSDIVRKQFTGYERDNEISLDFAEARYYGYNHGRFTSPDPLMTSARRSTPQTFNRYTYVLNNPYSLVDPSGMMACPPDYPDCQTDDGGDYIIDADGVKAYVDNSPPIVVQSEPGCTLNNSCSQKPAAGFVGPPPVVAPGAPAPVTAPPPGAAPSVGRAILGNIGRAVVGTMLAPGAVILALPSTVQAPAPLPSGQTTTTTTTDDTDRDPTQTIYRVFGGGSAMYGWSWTPVDPRTVPNPREGLGLPPENTGEFLVQGLVRTSNIQEIRPARPIPPNRGGLPEYVINPRNVIITMRMPLVPRY